VDIVKKVDVVKKRITVMGAEAGTKVRSGPASWYAGKKEFGGKALSR
jgi:hypothetical protein